LIAAASIAILPEKFKLLFCIAPKVESADRPSQTVPDKRQVNGDFPAFQGLGFGTGQVSVGVDHGPAPSEAPANAIL